ncbi:MAG: hypothetical protein ACKV2Q_13570 [Planctomycetaceae bacterium]
MNYTSKLTAGKTGWLIRENKVVSLSIGSVTIKAVANEDGSPSHTSVEYGFRMCDQLGKFKNWEEHPESDVFGSKDELLKSL